MRMWWKRFGLIIAIFLLTVGLVIFSHHSIVEPRSSRSNSMYTIELNQCANGAGKESREAVAAVRSLSAIKSLPQRCHTEGEQRVKYLRNWCQSKTSGSVLALDDALRRLSNSNLSAVYVDDRHQLLYCRIPKTGCTNWKKYFILLSGETNYTRIEQIAGADAHSHLFSQTVRSLSSYSLVEQRHIISNYFKFIIVRHPLTRLLSAYRNKFTRNNTVFAYTSSLIHRYNNNTSVSRQPTFVEFLKYITDDTGDHIQANAHWATYQQLCLPCSIQYDYIGQVETIARDSRLLLERINSTYGFPVLHSTSDSRVETEYLKLPPDLLYQVFNYYADDTHAFQYNC